MLSTAFLTHPEVYDQVDLQECVRVDLGTGVTQKLSTDFIRVVPQTSRNQLYLTVPWVRIPLAPPSRACNQADYRLFPFSETGNSVLFHFFGEKIIRSPQPPQHQSIPIGFRSRRPPAEQALSPSPVPR